MIIITSSYEPIQTAHDNRYVQVYPLTSAPLVTRSCCAKRHAPAYVIITVLDGLIISQVQSGISE